MAVGAGAASRSCLPSRLPHPPTHPPRAQVLNLGPPCCAPPGRALNPGPVTATAAILQRCRDESPVRMRPAAVAARRATGDSAPPGGEGEEGAGRGGSAREGGSERSWSSGGGSGGEGDGGGGGRARSPNPMSHGGRSTQWDGLSAASIGGSTARAAPTTAHCGASVRSASARSGSTRGPRAPWGSNAGRRRSGSPGGGVAAPRGRPSSSGVRGAVKSPRGVGGVGSSWAAGSVASLAVGVGGRSGARGPGSWALGDLSDLRADQGFGGEGGLSSTGLPSWCGGSSGGGWGAPASGQCWCPMCRVLPW